MRKFIIVLLIISLLGATVSIYFFWDWVITNPELTAGFLTSFLLLLAFFAALMNLRQMSHDRAISLAMKIRETYDSGNILEARSLVYKILREKENLGVQSDKDKNEHFLSVVKDYRINNLEDFVKLIAIPSLFDSIGWLVRKKCCEPKVIDETLDWEKVYELWEPYIREIQNKQPDEKLDNSATAMYGNFVWLVTKLAN